MLLQNLQDCRKTIFQSSLNTFNIHDENAKRYLLPPRAENSTKSTQRFISSDSACGFWLLCGKLLGVENRAKILKSRG
jgi:hypothetical protein